MPVYKLPGHRWLVRVYHRGKPHNWNVTGTRKDAEEWEAKKRLELLAGAIEPRSVPTFSVFCVEEYRPWAELRMRHSWWCKQSYMLATLIERLGDLSLRDIDSPTIDGYARGRLRDGLSPVSVNNEVRVLKRVLSFARKERRIVLPELRWSPLDEPGSDRVRAWTHEEVSRLLEVCAHGCERKGEDGTAEKIEADPELLPLLVCGVNTGLRKGEILALTWDHVDLEHMQLKIWPSAEWRPKNGKPREVPISDSLSVWLRGPRRDAKWVFPSGRKRKRGGYGRFAYWPQKRFDRIRAAAGLEGGPHTMRHTYATHFLEERPDLPLLAQILGHSDVAVTRLYGHLLPDHLASARNVVNVGSPVGPAQMEAQRRWKG